LTLLAEMQAAAAVDPGAPAVFERRGEELVEMTHGELAAASAALAGELRGRGVEAGDVVAVWLPNWSEALVWQFALAGLGATALGVNTRYSVHELTNLLRRGRPCGIVVPAAFLELDFVDRLRRAWTPISDAPIPWIATQRGDAPELDLGAGTWRPRGTAPPVGLEFHPERIATAFTTSGSSGPPKLAGHSQAAVAAHSRNVARAFEMGPGDVFLATLPLSGVFAFSPAMAMLAAGGVCLLEPTFDVPVVLADMEARGVTHVVGGDDMLGRLMDGWDPATMRATVRRGGIADFAGRSREFVAWARREWGAEIGGVYGSSELFALTAIRPPGGPSEELATGGGELVSTAIDYRVVDPEDGSPRPPGEVGELQFRGYDVLDEYVGTPELLAAATTADGWFRSGDLGVARGPSAFDYSCRNSDALRLRGFLVEPEEIERFLAGHPSVETARVVGATAGRGDVAVAFVSLCPGAAAEPDELLDYCRGELAPFKVPTRLRILDEWPLTTGTNGAKIRTTELRREAASMLTEGER
jgi:acyl-CoA synthetase (AMP-forming)/AMP-acid ligase II